MTLNQDPITSMSLPEATNGTVMRKLPASNFVERLRETARLCPDSIGYTFLADGENATMDLTFRQLDQAACALGQHLSDMGMSGQRALLLFPPGFDFVVSLFGCLYAGVTAVPALPPRRNRNMRRIQSIVADAQASLVLSVGTNIERSKRLVRDDSDLANLKWIAVDSIPRTNESNWKPPKIHNSTVAVLQYTSGSTGAPKGVMLTHDNLYRNCRYITNSFGANHHDIGLTWLPAYHDMGLVGGILNPMYIGTRTFMMSPTAFLQSPVRWLRAISRYQVTVTGGPNFAYDYCTSKITLQELEGIDLSSWKVAYNGAERVRATTLQEFSQKFARCGFRPEAFYPCYGMAESTLMITGGKRHEPPAMAAFNGNMIDEQQVVAVDDTDINARVLVGCGTKPPNTSIVIVNPNSHESCSDNEIGEIWVSGPCVGRGYFGKSRETEATFRAKLKDGPLDRNFLRTGDLGFFRDKQLYVTGRIKDLIIIRGMNRYSQDIELTVEQSSPRTRRGAIAAFSVYNDEREKLVIVSEVDRSEDCNWEEEIRTIRHNVALAHELTPDEIVLIRAGSIPMTSSGKIQRHECRRAFLDQSLFVVASWSLAQPISAQGTEPPSSADNNLPATINGVGEINGKAHGDHRLHDRAAFPDRLPTQQSNGAELSNADPTRERTDKERLETVFRAIRDVAPRLTISLSAKTNVLELGLDSLERMEIAHRIQDERGIRFPETWLHQMETCQDITDAINKLENCVPTAYVATRPDEIPADFYEFERFPEYIGIQRSAEQMKDLGISNPFFRVHEKVTRDTTSIEGREYINFASYNYLGMSGHPDVTQATIKAIESFGTSCSASRLVSGEKPIHQLLERRIAEFLGVESAITFVGGHSTNETTIGHLCGPEDLVVHDALAHNSILQGAALSGATRRQFAHNDWQSLDELLSKTRYQYRRVLIVIEGVYSMDGDYPSLADFIQVKTKHQALLMVDEAHSLGTMGECGRGIGEHSQIDPADVDIWMGTLSKSLGSCGGYIAGPAPLIEYLRYTAPGFVYSVGLSPPNTASALASLDFLMRDPSPVAKCQRNSRLFLTLCRDAGLDTGLSNNTPIIPVILGSSYRSLLLSERLFAKGINVQPIMYPAVAETAARLRFFVTSEHTAGQIELTVKTIARELPQILALPAVPPIGSPKPNGVPNHWAVVNHHGKRNGSSSDKQIRA